MKVEDDRTDRGAEPTKLVPSDTLDLTTNFGFVDNGEDKVALPLETVSHTNQAGNRTSDHERK